MLWELGEKVDHIIEFREHEIEAFRGGFNKLVNICLPEEHEKDELFLPRLKDGEKRI